MYAWSLSPKHDVIIRDAGVYILVNSVLCVNEVNMCCHLMLFLSRNKVTARLKLSLRGANSWVSYMEKKSSRLSSSLWSNSDVMSPVWETYSEVHVQHRYHQSGTTTWHMPAPLIFYVVNNERVVLWKAKRLSIVSQPEWMEIQQSLQQRLTRQWVHSLPESV